MFSSCQDESINSNVTIRQADLEEKKWKQIEGYSFVEDKFLPHDTFEFFNNGLYRASVDNATSPWNNSSRTHIVGKINFDDLKQTIEWVDVDTATRIPYSRPSWIFKEKTDSILIFETLVDVNYPQKNKQIHIKWLK